MNAPILLVRLHPLVYREARWELQGTRDDRGDRSPPSLARSSSSLPSPFPPPSRPRFVPPFSGKDSLGHTSLTPACFSSAHVLVSDIFSPSQLPNSFPSPSPLRSPPFPPLPPSNSFVHLLPSFFIDISIPKSIPHPSSAPLVGLKTLWIYLPSSHRHTALVHLSSSSSPPPSFFQTVVLIPSPLPPLYLPSLPYPSLASSTRTPQLVGRRPSRREHGPFVGAGPSSRSLLHQQLQLRSIIVVQS